MLSLAASDVHCAVHNRNYEHKRLRQTVRRQGVNLPGLTAQDQFL